jgi:hypothetical protein
MTKPSPWRPGYTPGGALGIWSHGSHTDDPDVCFVASVPDAEDEATARLIAAAPTLLAAAKLTALHFERNQASGNFQGDDEHEAWSALSKAIALAETK